MATRDPRARTASRPRRRAGARRTTEHRKATRALSRESDRLGRQPRLRPGCRRGANDPEAEPRRLGRRGIGGSRRPPGGRTSPERQPRAPEVPGSAPRRADLFGSREVAEDHARARAAVQDSRARVIASRPLLRFATTWLCSKCSPTACLLGLLRGAPLAPLPSPLARRSERLPRRGDVREERRQPPRRRPRRLARPRRVSHPSARTCADRRPRRRARDGLR